MKKKVLVDRPNHLAMVIRIEALGQVVILGSDLEVLSDRANGWKRVVDIELGRRRAPVLKVPHHGSENAFSGDHWRECLFDQPLAILTPFVHGRVVLPTDQGLKLLTDATDRVFMTCAPEKLVAKFRDKAVLEMMERATVSTPISLRGAPGRVTLRAKLSDPGLWTITTIGAAIQLPSRQGAVRVA
jgi:hypothetical protein